MTDTKEMFKDVDDKVSRDLFYQRLRRLRSLQLEHGAHPSSSFQRIMEDLDAEIDILAPKIPEGSNSQGRSQDKHSKMFFTWSPPYMQLESDKHVDCYIKVLEQLIKSTTFTDALFFVEQRNVHDNGIYHGYHYHGYLELVKANTTYSIKKIINKKCDRLFKKNKFKMYKNLFKVTELQILKSNCQGDKVLEYIGKDKPSKKIDVFMRKNKNISTVYRKCRDDSTIEDVSEEEDVGTS